MRPLFPFYGSKWRDARRYGTPAAHVIEPFAGSAGYSTYWEPSRVTLIDSDPIIANLWRYLVGASEQEIRALPDLEPGERTTDLAVSQEARYLIGFWLNRGSATPKITQTAYSKRTERGQLVWSAAARERIAASLHKIRDWRIIEGPYCTSIVLGDNPTWFIDPPYVDKGRYYRHHDVNYEAIGRWAQARPGHVIVCEQEGADWLPFEPLAEIKSTRGTSREVVWMNERRGLFT